MQHETIALEILSPEQRMNLYAIESDEFVSKLSDVSDMIQRLALATHPRKGMSWEEWFTRLCKFYEIPNVSLTSIHELTFDIQTDLWSKLLSTQGERMLKVVGRRDEFVVDDKIDDRERVF